MVRKAVKTEIEKESVIKNVEAFILDKDFPCLMAQALIENDNYRLKCYSHFGERSTADVLFRDLSVFVEEHNFKANNLETFIAVFPEASIFSEIDFEQRLWDQLCEIHNADTQPWDESVSSNPEHHCFSFSISGKAFYVIGMHPNSSRLSRQAPYAMMIFNLHHQFEHLRKRGVYDKIMSKIRNRDKALQGDSNPMLASFGEASEARQYSGRKVEDDWVCPFHKKEE